MRTPGPWIVTKEMSPDGMPSFYIRTHEMTIVARIEVADEDDLAVIAAAPSMLRVIEDISARMGTLDDATTLGFRSVIKSIIAFAKRGGQ